MSTFRSRSEQYLEDFAIQRLRRSINEKQHELDELYKTQVKILTNIDDYYHTFIIVETKHELRSMFEELFRLEVENRSK